MIVVHGLLGSAYNMRALTHYFNQNCFVVRTILLPGHGTRPGDLLNVSFHEWKKSVSYAIDSLSQDVDEIYLAGYSTGGTLAFDALINNEKVKTAILFAPALKINSSFDFLLPYVTYLKDWVGQVPMQTHVQYDSTAFNAGNQVHLLAKELRNTLKQKNITKPVLIITSYEDTTVDSQATLEAFEQFNQNPKSRFLLYTSKPRKIDHPLVVQTSSYLPQQGIISFSHLSVVTSPDNPIYGKKGHYRNCYHYTDDIKLDRCKHNPDYKGERTKENLSKGIVQRLTYHPLFDSMTDYIGEFLMDIEQ